MLKNTLSILIEQPMIQIGRASDMLWIHFGKLIEVKNYRGIYHKKGEYSLHIQCPWRFIQNDKLILGSNDFYSPVNNKEKDKFQWDILGANMFDIKAEELKKEVLPSIVKKLEVDIIGSINIYVEKEIVLQVFPVNSIVQENWRFINNLTGEHMVFNED